MVSKNDELNIISYEKYFGEMEGLPKEEIEKRIDMAEEMEVIFMYVFTTIKADIKAGNTPSIDFLVGMLAIRYLDLVRKQKEYELDLGYIEEYIEEVSKEILETTIKNISSEYFLSQERAKNLSGNESNSVRNYYFDLQNIANGKTKKTWVDMRDSKERHTHIIVGGTTIGIYDNFKVGKYEMRYPKDSSLGAGAEEIANCRCYATYS